MDAVDKVVVTNYAALAAKYGDRAAEVTAAVDGLISADADRGIRTALVALDDATAMGGLGAPPVTDAADPEQVKAAIDGVWRALEPDYLMILGAVDVVPHQPLRNPMPSDGDELVPGDLPYACEEPYSDDPADFIGPTRVVGRLPDVTAADDPASLVALLGAAAGWASRPAADYQDYLGISAKVWEGSTTLSLQNLFGNADDLQLSPTDGPDWPDELLARRTHFVNCHGAGADSHYYGQKGNSYPIAHDASLVEGRVTEGTVAAAECCYGAELYDPALAGGVAPMCNTYLAGGAYAFLGSSTIAYGPADGNGSADLLCQFFLRDVLAGASVGRAALQARQAFVRDVTVVDPADLKTLAQFNLMADPSVVPVEAEAGTTDARPKSVPGTASRSARRANLLANGLALPQSTSVARRSGVRLDDQPDLVRRILDLAGEPGMQASSAASFDVDEPAVTKSYRATLAGGDAPAPSVLHVVVHRAEATGDGTGSTVLQNVAVIAREQAGEIVAVRKLYAR